MRYTLGVMRACYQGLWMLLLFATLGAASTACKKRPAWERGKKVAHLPIRAKLGTLDPVRSSSSYDSQVRVQIYEGLYGYKYLVRPYQLEPLLAQAMPTISQDGLTHTIDLRKGVYFHDAPCFANGKGRELVAQDFVYSIKRMADSQLQPTGWGAYKNRFVGFDAFQQRMADRGDAPFDWDAEVEGLKAVGRYRLQITLTRPYPQLLYVLAMSHAAAVPKECVEHYGERFGEKPVGTGPFVLRKWVRGSRLILDKNPNYRDAFYPSEASPEFQHLLADAGKKLPLLDALVFHIYEQAQPMWLNFRAGDLDLSQVPAEYHDAVTNKEGTLRASFVEDGLAMFKLPLLDLVYRGFNMQDPVVGTGPNAKYLRQAIALAFDADEVNDAFYNNACVLYDGPVPPGLDAYEPGITSPYRGPKLEQARALMVKAGYPGGEGLPALHFESSASAGSAEQAEMLARALARIGIKLQVNLNSFAELSSKTKKGKAQMFGQAWLADYPDAENFLQLFYGPNRAPGANIFNYKNPHYDLLYEESSSLPAGAKRTALYQQMRELLIEDLPSFGHMARTRTYLWHKRLRNVQPDETFEDWRKYLNMDERR